MKIALDIIEETLATRTSILMKKPALQPSTFCTLELPLTSQGEWGEEPRQVAEVLMRAFGYSETNKTLLHKGQPARNRLTIAIWHGA